MIRLAVIVALLLAVVVEAHAQHILRGRVVDAKTEEPLEYVSVYLNNTTRGTATSNKGEFALPVPAGTYEVVVSYLGYEPIIYTVNSDNLPPTVLFKLQAKAHQLGVVEIKAKRGPEWYQNLEVFKEHFIGRSWIAKGCKLLNPEVLVIDFDVSKGVLSVRANGPLLIEHALLGYKLEYLLSEFDYNTKEGYVSYQGYPKYELMKGGKSKQRRWEKNRLAAYNGSPMHFLRALHKQQLEEEGFNLRRLYRVPNPKRPSEDEIAAARAYIRANGRQLNANDSISDILSRARLPKTVDMLDSNPVPYSEYLSFEKGKAILAFQNHMQVVYTGEKEEPAYIQSRINPLNGSSRPLTPSFQTSVLSLYADAVELEEAGVLLRPLDALFEGYWSWEKLGDMLPIDYQPGG